MVGGGRPRLIGATSAALASMVMCVFAPGAAGAEVPTILGYWNLHDFEIHVGGPVDGAYPYSGESINGSGERCTPKAGQVQWQIAGGTPPNYTGKALWRSTDRTTGECAI